MADFEVKLTGLKETQNVLYSYSQQLGDKVVIAALTLGARAFVRQAKANAPVRTGRLRRAIYVKRSRIYNGKRDTGKIGVFVSVRQGRKRDDQKGAWYRHIVEKKVGFMRSAFDSQKQKAVEVAVAAFLRGSESVKKRLGLK